MCIIMTGMGGDGARGLGLVRRAGGGTIAQDEGSSVVFGMARVAIEQGAAEHVVALEQLPRVADQLASGLPVAPAPPPPPPSVES